MSRVDRRPWSFSCWKRHFCRAQKVADPQTDLEHKMEKKRQEIEAQLRELETCELPRWVRGS